MRKEKKLGRKKGKAAIWKISSAAVAVVLVIALVIGLLPSASVLANEKVSDLSTVTKYTESLGDNASTEYAGRIWSDKSVYTGDATFELYGGDTATVENDEDFLVAYSLLATSQAIHGTTQVPIDVVFVIDLSGSMSNQDSDMDNDKSRIYNTVQAVNASIEKLMALNEYVRVGVVGFNDTATTLLPLDHYTKSGSNAYFSLSRETGSRNNATLYTRAVDSNGNRISTNTSVSGGTNIQMGMYQGMSLLANTTSTTATINGAVVGRVPSVILLSDGAPTFSSGSNSWWAPANNANDGPGNGSYAGNGMKAMMTASYMKDAVDRKYNLTAAANKTTIYTVGMGIKDLGTNDKNLAQITLNPTDYWNENNTYANTIRNAWNTYSAGYNASVAVNNGDSYTFSHPRMNDIDSINDYVDDYYDADNAASVTDVFSQIVSNITISAAQAPTEIKGSDPMTDGYVTYTDPLGEYMEVKDVKTIIYAGEVFNVKEKTTTGNTTTYVFEGEVHNPVYGDQNIDDIIIRVTKDAAGNETITVMIPASVIPVRVNTVELNENGTVKTHTNNGAYPTRVLYTVGLREDILVNGIVSADKVSAEYMAENINDDGTVNFYSNLYTGDNVVNGHTAGNTTVEFEAAHTNPFYYIQNNVVIYSDEACTQKISVAEELDDETIYYYAETYYHGTSVVKDNVERTGAQLKRTALVNVDGYWHRAAGSPRLNRMLEFKGTKVQNATNTAKDFYAPTFEYAEGSIDPYEGKFVVYLGNNGVLSLPASGNLKITKSVTASEGLTAPDKEFTFTVNFNGNDTLAGNYTYDVVDEAGNPVGNGTVTDGGTIALKAGYSATIRNLPPGTTYTVTEATVAGFTTSANGMSGTVAAGMTGYATFVNDYAVESITVPANEGFRGTKVLSGRDWTAEDAYTFMLESTDLTTPMPTGATEAGTRYVKEVTIADKDNTADGTAVAFEFGSITYAIPGTYEYIISEKLPASANEYLPGVSYSAAMYEVLVEVIDNGDGTLSATTEMVCVANDAGATTNVAVADKTADFTNTFNANQVEWTPVGSKDYTDNSGTKPLTDGMFEFTISVADGSPADTPLPATTTVTNVGTEIPYAQITFTQEHAGSEEAEAIVYTYEFKETIPAGAEENPDGTYTLNGMTYDGHTYIVEVKVFIEDGKIVVQPTYSDTRAISRVTFTNVYTPDPTEVTVEGVKTLIGRDMKAGETFEFLLSLADDTTIAAHAAGEITLGLTTATVSGGADGEAVAFAFDDVTFTKPGVYKFNVTETPDNAGGVTYDNHTAVVTVTVTDNNGELNAVVTYDNGAEGDATKAVFVNKYTATFDDSTAVSLTGTKNLTGQTLEAGEFYFIVEDQDGNAVWRTSTADNSADANGNYSGEIILLENVTYKEAGTYTYKITEFIPNQKVGGMTYDESVYEFTVVVTDDGNGRLYVSATALQKSIDEGATYAATDAVVFNNAYVPTPLVHTIWVMNKQLSGYRHDALQAGEFEFELYIVNADPADGMALPTENIVANAADGTITFGDLTFYKAGIYTLAIREVIPAGAVENPDGTYTLDGVTYSTEELFGTFRVTDDENGTLTATLISSTGGSTFTNVYASEGALELSVNKNFTGRENNAWLADDEFSFEMLVVDASTQAAIDAGDIVLPDNANGITITAADAEKTASFDEIIFKREGTYEFVIYEKSGNIPGVNYDSEPRTVIATAVDNSEGEITVTWEVKDGKELTFNNVYDAQTTELSGHLNLLVTKHLYGRENNVWLDTDKFTFTLATADDVTAEAVANGHIVLPATTLEITNANRTHAHFGNIIFHEAGTFKFTIKEEASNIGGVTDDANAVRTFIVNVEDNNEGVLVATFDTNSDSFEFTNIYTVDEVSLEGATNLKVTKFLDGRDWFADDEFEFTLVPAGTITGQAIEDGYVILPDNAAGITITANDLGGEKAFGDIIFKKAGTYGFMIKETVPNDADDKISYDTHSATVVVTVTDDNQGNLVVATPTYIGSMTFTNTYTPDPILATVQGKKVLEGRDFLATDVFTFVLDAVDGAPMPAVTTTTVENIADGREASFTFGPITYAKADTYEYTITETAGNISGITYDSETWNVTVEVTYEDATGTFTTSITYTKGTETNDTGVVFTNTYDADATDEVDVFHANKVVTPSEGNEFTLEGGEFTFVITPAENNPSGDPISENEVTNDENGNVVFAENVTYAVPGTYIYTVNEVSGNLPGITYDSNSYTITVVVEDVYEEGKLVADVTITDKDSAEVTAMTFENGYDPEETSAVFAGTKELDVIGSDNVTLTAGQFTFKLTAIDGAPMPTNDTTTNNATGYFNFETITYTAPGIYEYEITEVAGEMDGMTYDGAVYTAKVVVIDEGNGALAADITYEKAGEKAEVIFTNTYAPKALDITLTGTKVLTGRNLRDGEFTFRLYDENGELLDEVSNTADGNFELTAPTIEAEGTYTYVILEKNTGLNGVTYDENTYTVVLVVEDEDAELVVSERVYYRGEEEIEAIAIENSYEAASATVQLAAAKILNGRTLQADEFEFELKDEFGNVITTATNDAAGVVQFTEITYTEAGTYQYTISEKVGAAEGITYDETVYTVTVTVEDDLDGHLVATVDTEGNELVFINDYKEEEPPTEQPTEPPTTTEPTDSVETADNTSVMGYTLLALVVLVAAFVLPFSKKRA
ncbi:MAG: VWA domain-containing protein [Lachnospiraceae bacterium]|nr:VWA domain-containing protein [Lachnospiraceae bacterium]